MGRENLIKKTILLCTIFCAFCFSVKAQDQRVTLSRPNTSQGSYKVAVLVDTHGGVLGSGHIALNLINSDGVITHYSYSLKALKEHPESYIVEYNASCITRYNSRICLSITKKEYTDMMFKANQIFEKGYFLLWNDCASFVKEVLNAAGITFLYPKVPNLIIGSIRRSNESRVVECGVCD